MTPDQLDPKVPQELPAPIRPSPVLRDLRGLPVPKETRDRLDHLEQMERLALLGLMELQVRRVIPETLVLRDPRAILETPALLVLLDRQALLELLELLDPRATRGT